MFAAAFVLNGLAIACLRRKLIHMKQLSCFHYEDSLFLKRKNTLNPKCMVTYGEGLRNLERLILSAKKSIHMCAFALHLERIMPCGQSLASIINRRAECGVLVHILMNSTCEYANLSPLQTRQQLHPSVHLYASKNPTHEFRTKLLNQTGYSFAHIKMCCVDLATMQIGCVDVDPWERLDYNVLNKNNFAWHEIAIEIQCTNEISEWITTLFQCGSFNVCLGVYPFPLVNGGPYEASVMCDIISTAKNSIYMEHQIISMGPSEDMSVQRILECIALKIAFVPHFQLIIITNTKQDDEYTAISRHFSSLSLLSTIYHLKDSVRRLMTKAGLMFNDNVYRKQVSYLELFCTGGQNLKTHSNITIVDTSFAIRSSSNITSRSLGFNPCDTELGVVFENGVESLLHKLICLHCPLLEDKKPSITMFLKMVNSGLSHAKPVKIPNMPLSVIETLMSVSHLHAASGHCHGKMQLRQV